MAEDGEEQLECILCDKTIVPGTERVVKEAAIKRFCDASLVHEDNKHKIMSGKKELVIHVNCHSKYLRTDKIQDQKNLARCSRRRSTIEARLFEFNKFCFFCGDDACDEVIQRQQKEFGKAFVKIRRVEKEDTIKHVIEELETRKTLSKLDDQCKIIYSRLNGMKDILKMNPRYHISCHISFYNFSITKDKGRPKNDTITDAVYFVIDYLESNSEDCQFSLKSILNKFEKNEGLDLRYIKRKIESEINDCVIIYPSDNDYIICYRKVKNILSNDWYTVRCENREDERKRLVKLAGSIILQDILSMKYDLDKYPSPSNFLEESQSLIPQTLKIFLDIIIKENKKSVKFTDRLENKVQFMAHSLIASARPRSFISPILLGTSTMLHKYYASRFLIDTLSHISVCASYAETMTFQKVIKNDPERYELLPDAFINIVFDNVDHNTNTHDGKNTCHGMGGILIVTPFASALISGEYARPGIKKIKEVSNRSDKITFVPYKKPDTPGLKNVIIEKLPFDSDVKTTSLDFFWFYNKSSNAEKTAFWSGFMEKCTEIKKFDRSKIILLPLQYTPPSNLSTILSSLLEAERIRSINNFDHIFVTFDQPLYQKAREIIAHVEGTDLELSNVTIILGAFHAAMSFLGSIGYIMKGSGIKEAFSVLYAEASAEQALGGKAYSRAVKGHIRIQCALTGIVLQHIDFDENEKNLLNDLKNKIGEDDFQNLFKNDMLSTITDKFNKKLLALKNNGPTAQLWVQYIKMVEILKQLIQAQRVGNWDDYLLSWSLMIPIFHASGHNLYAKSGHLFLQDMIALSDKLEPSRFVKLTQDGYFTIRRANKYRSGIATDQTIEQTLMRDFKSRGGVTHGRGLDKETVSTWIDTALTLNSVNTTMENFFGVSYSTSEQHVDLQNSNLAQEITKSKLLREFFDKHNPFPETDKILSISSGIVGDQTINCYKAFEIGQSSLDKIIGKDFKSVVFSRKNKVLPLSAVKSSLRIEGQVVNLDPTLIFMRIALKKRTDEETKKYLQYELAAYPLSLFDENGMRKTAKSSFYMNFGQIEKLPFSKDDKITFVVDGGFLLHRVIWHVNDSVEKILQSYVSYINNNFHGNVIVVFDGYPELDDPNLVFYTKHGERSRRANLQVGYQIDFDNSTHITLTQEKFLSNNVNKKRFIKFLSQELNKSKCITVSADEDADVLIVETALKCSEADNNVVVVGEDVDLIVILNQRASNDKICLWKKARSGGDDEFYNSQCFVPNELKKYVGFIHALTGCDTTSCFYNQGKKKLIDTLLENDHLLSLVDSFYDCNASKATISKNGVKVIAHMYATKAENKKNTNIQLNDLRFKRFEKAAYTGSYDLKNLPPTETASEQHSYRTYHQLQMWLGNKKDSTQWGWQVTENGLQPVLTENGAYLVPEDILKTISCSCKTGCNSTRCGCRKVGLKCTHLCSGCSGENCSNIIKRVVTNNGIINEYEEDMMETDDNTEVIDDMRAEEIDEEEEEGQEEMIEDEVDLENQSNYSEATTKRRRIK